MLWTLALSHLRKLITSTSVMQEIKRGNSVILTTSVCVVLAPLAYQRYKLDMSKCKISDDY